jgi:glycosyltransferase involved in cell wall biosynthesis
MKISVLTSDFSGNCFGRSWLLAKLLQKKYDVEVIGPAFNERIWKPLEKECDFEIKMVKGHSNGQFEFIKMLKLIEGDIIYANKPIMGSFGVGLVKKLQSRIPLVLDIDDWQPGFGKEFYDSLIWYKKLNDFRRSVKNMKSYYYNLILEKLIWAANEITVSGTCLKEKYGGNIIWHSRNINLCEFAQIDKKKLRKKYLSINDTKSFVIGFIGTPRPHKGIEDLIDALSFIKYKDLYLVIVGINRDFYCSSLKRKILESEIKEKVILLPEQPFGILPELLSTLDLVVIPQRLRPASYGQIPAKIFDAMAMAKPIIATNIKGIPEILDDCGLIAEAENPKELAREIKYLIESPTTAAEIGMKAYKKFKKEYHWDIVQRKLTKIFENFST